MFLIPNEKFKNPENKEKIYEALEKFYSSDVLTEEFEDIKANVLAALKDEPEIMKMIKEDLV